MTAEAQTSHKAWNKASERLMAIQAEWRTIGFAPKKDNNKVYDRFRAACDKFFESKHAFYAEAKEDMTKNLEVKTALCERAEAIAEREDWAKATEDLLALQADWKKSGAVSRKYADTIWKRFRAACDKFFERKSQHFSSVDNEYSANLAAKQALLEEMKQSSVSSFDDIKEYQRRWSEIGFVPIRHKESLQKQYKEILDKMFAVVRGADREQQMNKFKNKVSSMRESGDKRLRNEREKLYNRVKQLEQVEHRLSMRTSGGITILDDAYNSNPTGARMALEVLSGFATTGAKYVVTPGFVEMGAKQYDNNRAFGRDIAASKADGVIVVNKVNREAITAGLEAGGYDMTRVSKVASFKEAMAELQPRLKAGDVVLYENDLPDSFK